MRRLTPTVRRLPPTFGYHTSERSLTRKSSKILFRDSGQPLVITEDLHESLLVEIKYLGFIFQLQK